MIIKSVVRGNGGQLANYLLNDPKNDRAELLDMRGWTAENLKNAFLMSEEIAHGQTQCEKPFYHVSFRLAPGEELQPEQWEHCADALEKRVGLEEHHRAMIMHTYKGEKHLHVVWDRIDENMLKAAELSFEHLQCKKTARALEKELGLQQVRDKKREPEKELAAPTREEEQQARRKGQDLQNLRASIREAWEKSENGKSFAEALDERGFTLAQGEKRDYVAIDEQGSVYSIGKRTTGATAREVRAKLADLDREHIPTVEQARASLAERQQEREPERAALPETEREPEPARAEPTEAQGHEHPTPSARESWDEAAERVTAPERTEEPEQGHERGGGLRVLDRETGLESSVSAFAGKVLDYMATQAEGLIEGMASLFDGGSAAPREGPPLHRRPRKSALQVLQEQAAANRALRNLSQSVKRREDLNAADVRALPRTHLERLRDGGDEYLKRLVQHWEREREEQGRERER